MFCRQLIRISLNNLRQYATEASPLAALRKKTGYSFVNCKKALEVNNNDVIKVSLSDISWNAIGHSTNWIHLQAEQWLREQAQSLGWAKATKLEGRVTGQGLVGVLIQRNIGAMVEVNCETDFVARNEHFQQFVELASKACLQYVNDLPQSDDLLSRTEFQSESLKNLVDENGKKLSDAMVLMIGLVGENASLRRAVCFKVPDAIQLTGMAYPTVANTLAVDGTVQLGTYGTILGLRSPNAVSDELKKNLCMQVIGMNPLKVGDKLQDKPAAEKEDETSLIYQDYLFGGENTVDVGEVLEANELDVVDFQRFRCGEAVQCEQLDKASASNWIDY